MRYLLEMFMEGGYTRKEWICVNGADEAYKIGAAIAKETDGVEDFMLTKYSDK